MFEREYIFSAMEFRLDRSQLMDTRIAKIRAHGLRFAFQTAVRKCLWNIYSPVHA